MVRLAYQREQKPRYITGVSQCSEDLWQQTTNEKFKHEVALYRADAQVFVHNVRDDTPKQIANIERFIEQKVDMFVASLNESETCAPVVEKAYQRGIPVILVDRRITTESYTAYVGANNYQIGKEARLYVISVFKGRDDTIEVCGTKGSTSDAERHKGLADALAKTLETQIVAEVRGNYLFDEAKKQLQFASQQHPNIDLVFAMDDPMAAGACQAAIQFNGKPSFIVGVDVLIDGGIKSVENNVQDALFIYLTGGEKVTDPAMEILHNRLFQRENISNAAVVDKSSVRILQLQTEQTVEKQAKIGDINQQLSENLIQHTN